MLLLLHVSLVKSGFKQQETQVHSQLHSTPANQSEALLFTSRDVHLARALFSEFLITLLNTTQDTFKLHPPPRPENIQFLLVLDHFISKFSL